MSEIKARLVVREALEKSTAALEGEDNLTDEEKAKAILENTKECDKGKGQ